MRLCYAIILTIALSWACSTPQHGSGSSSNKSDLGSAGQGDSDSPSDEAINNCVPKDCPEFPPLANKAQYPILLVHGMGGFDELGPIDYFNGIRSYLLNLGYAAYTPVTDPMNGSDVRAKQLAEYIDRLQECTCAQKFNLIGHSQGGIDARYIVNVMGYGDRIASVTTIAAPHGGTRIADAILGLIPGATDELINFFAWLIGGIYTDPKEDPNTRSALTWCSTQFLKEFTEDYPNDPQVAWFSYAGRAGLSASGKPECENAELKNPKSKTPMHGAMLPGWVFLGGIDGVDNDGLVTVDNAKMGRFRGCLPADHLQEVGLFLGIALGYDHKEFFKDLAQFLTDEGH